VPVSIVPNASMNVLLPTPGTPVMPSRIDDPVRGRSGSSSSRAGAACFGLVDSMSVMARPSTARSPSHVDHAARKGVDVHASAGWRRALAHASAGFREQLVQQLDRRLSR
jgi:hypothetical protein